MELGADTRLPQLCRQGDGGGEVLRHRQDQHIRRGGGQLRIQHPLLAQHIEQPGQADGNAHAGELLVRVELRQIVIPSAGAHGADLRVIQQRGLIDRAGVVIQTTGNGEIHGEILRRYAKVRQILHHGVQLAEPLIEHLVSASVALQRRQDLCIAALDGDELQDLIGVALTDGEILYQNGFYFFGTDLIQLVHGAHHVGGFLRQAQHGVEAVQDLPVVHPDLEPLQAQGGEGLIDDRGDLRLVGDVQLAVADDVNVRLIELTEPAPLGTLAPIHLADLIPAEGEGQLIVVEGHILGQRHRQVKAEGEVAVALLEAVDLLFRLAAGLGQQHLTGFNDRGIQGREAVQGIGLAEDLHNALHLLLGRREKLHKAGQRPGGHFCHKNTPFRVILLSFSAETGRYRIVKTAKKRSRPIALGRELTLRGATQIRGRLPPLAFWYGKGTVDASVPAPPLSFLRGRRDAFSIAPLSVRLRSGLLLRRHSGVFI